MAILGNNAIMGFRNRTQRKAFQTYKVYIILQGEKQVYFVSMFNVALSNVKM